MPGKYSRRNILRTGSIGLGASLLGLSGGAHAANQAIGIQLYTVRDRMAQSLPDTLTALSTLGYREVEFAGYYEHSPKQIKTLLTQLNLISPSTHVALAQITDNLSQTLDIMAEIGHEYVVLAYLSPEQRKGGLDGYKRYAELFSEVGIATKKMGMQFGYHNHAFEFEAIDGVKPYDLLLQQVDSDLMKMTMDLFWINKAGHDPLDYFAKHPGRFAQCHVKDMDAAGNMVDVGAGIIDFAAIFLQREIAGFEHFYVEHDQPADSLASAKRSLAHLQNVLG